MLQTLHLHNFALVFDNEINFDQGFNVITGETGAGKSLLLDALSLAIGGRANADLVRFGAKNADIYAHFFDNSPMVQAWFATNERDACDGDIVIRRQLSQEGRSKAWINGTPASLAELRSLGAMLVNIHSQHAGLELLKPSFALKFLDSVGGFGREVHNVQRTYEHWQSLIKQQQQLAQNAQNRLDRIMLLSSQLADVEPLLNIDITAIESSYEELSNIEALISDAQSASVMLNSDDDIPNVLGLLGRAIKLCEHNSQLSESFALAHDNLTHAYELIYDSALSLSDYSQNQSSDDAELERLNHLLSLAHKLSTKYRMPIDELLAQVPAWQQELSDLQSVPDTKSLDEAIDDAYADYKTQAQRLHAKRTQFAPSLCKQLTEQLAPLALPNATCEFSFDERETPASFGLYDVQLLFSANVGMPLLPLHKVASGGELSRIALVMQVMQVIKEVPVLIFDEVDVGISGGTAQVVGELLRQLGTAQQIIAITHQAQVAACSHCHILVEKEQGEQTISHFMPITKDKQVYELARMSGGVVITDETLAHAKSLLDGIDSTPKKPPSTTKTRKPTKP